jgi:hypothetical protein
MSLKCIFIIVIVISIITIIVDVGDVYCCYYFCYCFLAIVIVIKDGDVVIIPLRVDTNAKSVIARKRNRICNRELKKKYNWHLDAIEVSNSLCLL